MRKIWNFFVKSNTCSQVHSKFKYQFAEKLSFSCETMIRRKFSTENLQVILDESYIRMNYDLENEDQKCDSFYEKDIVSELTSIVFHSELKSTFLFYDDYFHARPRFLT